jgi:hypothetical protein
MTWAAHDDPTAPDIGSGLRAKLFPEEELVSALTAIARARGESHRYAVSPGERTVPSWPTPLTQRIFTGAAYVGNECIAQCTSSSYQGCVDGLLWQALREKAEVML